MKKSYIALLIVLCTAIVFVLYLLIGGKGIYNKTLPNVDFSILGAFKNNPLQDTLYINVENNKDEELTKLLNEFADDFNTPREMNGEEVYPEFAELGLIDGGYAKRIRYPAVNVKIENKEE